MQKRQTQTTNNNVRVFSLTSLFQRRRRKDTYQKSLSTTMRRAQTTLFGTLSIAWRAWSQSSAVVVVADGIIAQGQNAGTLAKSIGSFMGGGGGGKAHLATAGGSDVEIIEQAMDQTKELIINCLTELE